MVYFFIFLESDPREWYGVFFIFLESNPMELCGVFFIEEGWRVGKKSIS